MKINETENGNVLIEFALIASIMILVFSGIVDYGIYIHHQMEMTEAAAAGAALGTFPGQQKDTAAMRNVALLSAPDVSSLTATATYFYACTPSGAQVPSTTVCGSGWTTNPLMYVQVTTTASVPAAMKWIGLASSLSLKGQATYRVPWVQ